MKILTYSSLNLSLLFAISIFIHPHLCYYFWANQACEQGMSRITPSMWSLCAATYLSQKLVPTEKDKIVQK